MGPHKSMDCSARCAVRAQFALQRARRRRGLSYAADTIRDRYAWGRGMEIRKAAEQIHARRGDGVKSRGALT